MGSAGQKRRGRCGGSAVASVLWGRGIAQYPFVLTGQTVAAATGDPAVLSAVLWIVGLGALLLVPSLVLLFPVFQRGRAGAR